MALYGGLAENTRRNERFERGSSTVTGSLVVTVSSPMRQVTNVQATIVIGTGALDPALVTVTRGTGANSNQFTIFVWKFTSSSNPTPIASTTATVVDWVAFGNLSAGAGF